MPQQWQNMIYLEMQRGKVRFYATKGVKRVAVNAAYVEVCELGMCRR